MIGCSTATILDLYIFHPGMLNRNYLIHQLNFYFGFIKIGKTNIKTVKTFCFLS